MIECQLMKDWRCPHFWVVSPLSVVPLKIGKNNCKPGEMHREMPFIHEIPTLYRANLAEDRHQHSRGGLSRFENYEKFWLYLR